MPYRICVTVICLTLRSSHNGFLAIHTVNATASGLCMCCSLLLKCSPPPQHPQIFAGHLLKGLYSNVTFAVTPFLNTLPKMEPTPHQLPIFSSTLFSLHSTQGHPTYRCVYLPSLLPISLLEQKSVKAGIFILFVALSPVSRTELGTCKYLASIYLHK